MTSPITFTSAGSAPVSDFGSGAPTNLQKASQKVHRPPRAGGTAQPGELIHEIGFQFNPPAARPC